MLEVDVHVVAFRGYVLSDIGFSGILHAATVFLHVYEPNPSGLKNLVFLVNTKLRQRE